MTDTEALGFIGTLLMRMMGVSLVIADSIPMGGTAARLHSTATRMVRAAAEPARNRFTHY